MAQPVLAVRSKIGLLAERGGNVRVGSGRKKWVLEAQLENVGGEGIVVERCCLKAGVGVVWRGGIGGVDGNGDGDGDESEGDEVRGKGSGGGKVESVVLRPRDVQQVMFVVEDREAGGAAASTPKALAQVDIDWRSAMGEKGRLTTGWLAARG